MLTAYSWAWPAFAVAALGAGVLTPSMICLARRLGALARPRPDRWHRRPTALLGGAAIYAASLGTAAAMLTLAPAAGRASQALWMALGGAATLVFLLGLVDDLRGLAPRVKVAVQGVAASWLVSAGVRVPGVPCDGLAVPLTIGWLVAITNAVILLDNMDGVAPGVAAVASLALAAWASGAGQGETARLALALAGACCGFLSTTSIRRASSWATAAASIWGSRSAPSPWWAACGMVRT